MSNLKKFQLSLGLVAETMAVAFLFSATSFYLWVEHGLREPWVSIIAGVLMATDFFMIPDIVGIWDEKILTKVLRLLWLIVTVLTAWLTYESIVLSGLSFQNVGLQLTALGIASLVWLCHAFAIFGIAFVSNNME